MTSTSEKPKEVPMEEEVDLKAHGYDTYGLVKSRYDELSVPRTLWVSNESLWSHSQCIRVISVKVLR
jgi:hypothetical protein